MSAGHGIGGMAAVRSLPVTSPASGPFRQTILFATPDQMAEPGSGFRVGLTDLDPGAGTASLRHRIFEFACMLEGSAEMTMDGRTYTLSAGEFVVIAPRIWHSFRNTAHVAVRMMYVFGANPAEFTEQRHQPTTGLNRRTHS